MFLVHFRGEWHSGIPYYTQNRKISGSNTTNALGQTFRPNLLIRLLVDFGSHLKVLWLTLNESGFLLVNGPKLTLLLIKKSLKKLHVLFFFFFITLFEKETNIHCSIGSISRPISSNDHNYIDLAVAMDRCQSYFRKRDKFFSGKQ